MNGDSRGLERHHKKEEFCSKSQAKKQAITCEKLHYCTPRCEPCVSGTQKNTHAPLGGFHAPMHTK